MIRLFNQTYFTVASVFRIDYNTLIYFTHYVRFIVLRRFIVAKGKVTFNENLCKGCGLCVAACPKKILELDKTRLNSKGYHPATSVNPDECIGCAFCATQCPDVVITVERF